MTRLRCARVDFDHRTARRAYTCLICSEAVNPGDSIAYFSKKRIACHWRCFVYEAGQARETIHEPGVRQARTVV